MTIISKDISKAIKVLNRDELVAIPTETVYGLAGNIFSEKAIKKIFSTKKRPFFNPLIVHLYNYKQLESIVSYIPPKAEKLAKSFWPGSLTLVLPKNNQIPDLVTAGKDTVAVRIPNHKLTLELLEKLNFPLAAPSANPFGSISPTSAHHVKSYFEGQIEMILDGGNCNAGIESTIVGFNGDEPIVYRLGSTSIEDIEQVIGNVTIQNRSEAKPVAPGMLSRHYAPKKQTYLVDDVSLFLKENSDKKIGLLLFTSNIDATNVIHTETLSLEGKLIEATQNLYAALHRLDSKEIDIIVCEKLPNVGLGKTINDRLERATKK